MYVDKNKIEDLILELGLVSQDDFDLAEEEAETLNLQPGKERVRSYQVLLKKEPLVKMNTRACR